MKIKAKVAARMERNALAYSVQWPSRAIICRALVEQAGYGAVEGVQFYDRVTLCSSEGYIYRSAMEELGIAVIRDPRYHWNVENVWPMTDIQKINHCLMALQHGHQFSPRVLEQIESWMATTHTSTFDKWVPILVKIGLIQS